MIPTWARLVVIAPGLVAIACMLAARTFDAKLASEVREPPGEWRWQSLITGPDPARYSERGRVLLKQRRRWQVAGLGAFALTLVLFAVVSLAYR